MFCFISLFFFLDSEAMKSTGAPKEKSGRCQRLQWSNENMEAAMEAVKARRMTSTAAATTFSVPRKTRDATLNLGLQSQAYILFFLMLLPRKR